MNLARGAAPRFDNAASLLLDQIGKLKDGKITLTDTKVFKSGNVMLHYRPSAADANEVTA